MVIDLTEQYCQTLVSGINRLNVLNSNKVGYFEFNEEYECIHDSLSDIEGKVNDRSLDSRDILELKYKFLKLKVDRDVDIWGERYD